LLTLTDASAAITLLVLDNRSRECSLHWLSLTLAKAALLLLIVTLRFGEGRAEEEQGDGEYRERHGGNKSVLGEKTELE